MPIFGKQFCLQTTKFETFEFPNRTHALAEHCSSLYDLNWIPTKLNINLNWLRKTSSYFFDFIGFTIIQTFIRTVCHNFYGITQQCANFFYVFVYVWAAFYEQWLRSVMVKKLWLLKILLHTKWHGLSPSSCWTLGVLSASVALNRL